MHFIYLFRYNKPWFAHKLHTEGKELKGSVKIHGKQRTECVVLKITAHEKIGICLPKPQEILL